MRRLLLGFLTLLIGLVVFAAPTYAATGDPLLGNCTSNTQDSCVDCSGAAKSSAICSTNKDTPIAGKDSVLLRVTNAIAIIAGIAAVIMIIVGGMQYVFSNGDSNDINSAKNTIIYALIGLVVIVAAKILITFVVSKVTS